MCLLMLRWSIIPGLPQESPLVVSPGSSSCGSGFRSMNCQNEWNLTSALVGRG